MTDFRPLKFRWTGDAMKPSVPAAAAAMYETGKTYWLELWVPASSASRGHYFASIREAWDNLPETLADRFPSPEHLRKYCLIRAGWRDERTITAASQAEARRVAAFIRPLDDFAVVVVREATIVVYTAKSQSAKAMGRAGFQKSKEDVLGTISEMIGVERRALEANAGRAA